MLLMQNKQNIHNYSYHATFLNDDYIQGSFRSGKEHILERRIET